MRVAIFTDNDFDKTNGVTTTLKALLRHAPPDLRPRIYTLAELEVLEPDYLALRAAGLPIPFYGEMRMYVPRLRELRGHLRADGARLLHLTTPGPACLAGRYLAARLHLPAIGSFHTQLEEYTAVLSGSTRLGRLMGRYMRWMYGTCDPVFVPSVETRRRLEARGWCARRLAIWPRGVDTAVFSPARRSPELRARWRVSDRRPAILYAGRLSREKGLAIVERLESLLCAHRLAHRLVFVGDGPMGPELRRRFPDAVFTGMLPHDRVAVAMASADIFLFPSETDTAGNVVLEAQASGLPVIVTDVGGPQENMRDGDTGFVCYAGDSRSFCARIAELLRDGDERRAMSIAARRYAETRTWAVALEPLFAAYRAAMRAPAREPGSPTIVHGVAGALGRP
jgi:glycosyltransferase involved in cell wall biosynthesis